MPMLKSLIFTALALLLGAAALPVNAERYILDEGHTYPSLEFSHMGISIWRGKFNRTTGSLDLDLEKKSGHVEVEVDAASIDFGHDEMNEHALKEDWLHTTEYPTLAYSGDLVFEGDQLTAVDGKLTLRGVTKPLRLKVNSFNCIQHPFYQKPACGADAEAVINRAEFGMDKYAEGEMGKVTLRIQVEALKDVGSGHPGKK